MAFSDYLKKYREAQASQTPSSTSSNTTSGNTQQSTSKSSGSGKFRDSLQRYRASQLSTITLEEWDAASKNLLAYTQDRASRWFDKAEYESLYNKYTTLLSQADGWRRKYMGNDEAISYIDSIASALDGAKQYSAESFRHYSKWKTAEDYSKDFQAYQKQQEEDNNLLNYDLKAAADELKSYRAAQDEMRSLMLSISDMKDIRYQGAYTQADIAAADARYKELEQKYGYWDELNDLISKKQEYYDKAEKRQKHKQQEDYFEQFRLSPDFEEKSKYASTYRGGEVFSAVAGMYTDTGFDDIEYDAINRNETARDRIRLADLKSGSAFLGYDKSYLYEMTDEEIALYNSLYDPNDKTASDEYLKFLLSDLNYRRRATQQQQWAQMAKEDPVGTSIASILMAPSKSFTAIGQVADYVSDGAIDQNAGYNKFSHIPSSIRGQVASDIAESGNWGEVGSWTYQLGMSMGDFLMTTAASGGNKYLSLALMGSGAMADATIAAKDRGLSDDQAFTLGIVAGVAEIITEKFSLDALFDVGADQGVMRYILTNAITEGTEEVGSSVINLAADVIVSKDKSEWQMAIQKYLDENPDATESEAFQKVLRDEMLSLGLDFLGGTIMGGVMGSGGATINTVAQNAQYRADGSSIMGVDGGKDALMNLANEVAGVSDSKKLTKQIDKANRRTTAKNVGKLYDTVKSTNNSMNQADIAKSLERKGFSTGTANDIAEVLVASYNGQELTKTQSKLLESAKNSKVVQEAIADIVENKNSTMGQRSQNIRNFSKDIALGRLAKAAGVSVDEIKNVTGNLTDTDKNAPETTYEVSDNGETILKSTGDPVSIKEIASIKDGRMTLRLEDGTEVDSNDVEYSSEAEALIYETIAEMGVSAEGANTLIRGFDTEGDMSASVYANAVNEAYQYGQMGARFEDISPMGFAMELNESLRKYAYNLGEMALATQKTSEYNNTTETEAENDGTGEWVHLRRGVQRTDSEGSDGSVRGVVEGTGAVQNRQEETAGRSGDGSKNYGKAQGQVSTKELGVPNGTEDSNLRYASEETAELKEAKEFAKKNGLELVAFEGGNLTVNGKDGVFEARAYIYGNKVVIRADHPRFSLMQLLKHEVGHHKIRKGNVDMKKVYDAIVDFATEEYVQYVIESYVTAYASLKGYDADYILEEILCDYEAGMNIFSKDLIPDSFWDLSQEILESDAVKKDSVRGPPDSGKASRDNKQEVGLYGEEGQTETQRSFLARMREGSRRIRKIGEIAVAYEPARALDTSGTVSDAAREFRRLGIKYFYHNGLEYNHNGKTHVDNGAFSAIGNKVVGIYAKAYGNGVDFAGHEAFHVWKKTTERAEYVDVLRDNINFGSSVYGIKLADTVLKEYFGDDPSALQDTNTQALFFEELYALVSGQIHSGTHEAGLRTMLKDYDAVKAAWDVLVESQVPEQTQPGKFSREFVREQMTEKEKLLEKANQTLERENSKLQEDNQYLKELVKLQKTVTGGAKFTKTSIESAAKILKKQANVKANADTKALAKLLEDFYGYIAKGDDITWESVMEQAQPVVDWLQKNEKSVFERDQYAQEVLDLIKGRSFYIDDVQKGEAKYAYGSYQAFRQKLLGTFTVSDNARGSLDSFWKEMAGNHPYYFPEGVTGGDQVTAIVDTLSSLRNAEAVPEDAGYEQEMKVRDLLYAVYDSYWNISTLYTVADVKQKEINHLKMSHSKKLSEIRSEHNSQTKKLKEYYQKRIRELREEYRERTERKQQKIIEAYQASKKKAAESRSRTALRHKIKDFRAKLERTLLKPTDRQYVPIDLIKAMVEVCELIDTDTSLYKAYGEINKAQERRNLTKEKLQALKDEYEKLKTHSDPIYAGEFDEMVYTYLTELRDKYSGKHLNDMSLDELMEMYEILRAIDETLRDARKLIGWGDAENVYEAGDAIVSEQKEITQSRKNGKRNIFQKTNDSTLNLSLSPVRNVERMSGYNGDSYLLKLFKKFEQGIRKKNKFMMDAYKSFESLTSGKEYDDAMYTEVGGKKYEDVNGRKFGVSKMQMMQAILSYERETANGLNHIQGSGFSFADLTMLRKGKLKDAVSEEYSHRVPAAVELVAEFTEALKNDKWCQDYMAAARKFFNGTAKDAINETSIAMKHRIIAKEKSYIPYEVDKNFVVREISAENEIQQTINSYGMLKETKKGASQPLIITGLNNILDRHIDQVGNVYGLAIEVRNFNKVWNVRSVDEVGNDPTVKTAIQRNWGVEGVKHIEQAVKDIQGRRIRERFALDDKVKSGYIGATFLLNLSVVTKQIGSLFSATSMLRWRDPARQVGNLVYTMINHKKIAAEVDKYTASAWMRRQGLSDAEVHTLITQSKKPGLFRLLSKAPAIINPTKWITAMDHAVALSLWKYAKIDTAKRTGLKGEALLEATAEFYDEVIENTQSMTDVLHRPEIQKRGGVISEAFGMFKTDLYQMAGQLHTTTGRFMANRTKENAKALSRTVYSIVMNAVWGQLMTTVFALLRYKVKPYRDEEDEELTAESWLKRQGFSFAGDLLGYIFPIFGSEIVGVFENIMYGESEDIVDSLVLTAINDLYDTMITVGTSIKDGEMPEPADMKKLTAKALQVFGIPANNILRTWEAIQLHAKDIANGEFLSFEAGVDRSPKHHIHRIIEAVDTGKTDVAIGLFEEAIEEEAMGKSDDGSYGEDELNEARSSLQTALGDKYKDGEVSKETARKILSEVFGKSEEEIYWIFDQWDYSKENGSSDDYAKYSEFFTAVETGKNLKAVITKYTDNGVSVETLASQITSHYKPLYIEMSTAEKANIKGYILNAMTVLGKTREEAEETVRGWEFESKYGFAYAGREEAYKTGKISASELKNILMTVGGKTAEEADLQIQAYDWEEQGYDGVTAAAVRDYNNYCAGYSVPKDVYLHIRSFANNTKNDVDSSGKTIDYSAMKKIMAEINSQYRLTSSQKTAIARSLGWAEKNIQKYKLW